MAGSKGTHKSIYIPADLAAKLEENAGKINFSRVCRTAVESALDETAKNGVSVGTVLKDVRQREEEVRQLKKMIQGLIRHASTYCDMTVLSDKDAEAYHEVFDKGVESFIFKIKQEALEEAKVKRKRATKKTKKNTSKKVNRLALDEPVDATPAPDHAGYPMPIANDLPVSTVATCPICNQAAGDVPCEGGCQEMICWFCWGEMDEKSPGQPKTCPACNKPG